MKAMVIAYYQVLVYLLDKTKRDKKNYMVNNFILRIRLSDRASYDIKYNFFDNLQIEKKVGVVFYNDNFFNVRLMLVDIENEFEKYKDIIRYFKSMHIQDDAIKQIKTKNTCKFYF